MKCGGTGSLLKNMRDNQLILGRGWKIALGCSAAALITETAPGNPANEEPAERFINHGIAAPSGQAGWGGIVATEDADGTPLIVVHLWAGDGDTRTISLLLINAETGESEQYQLPGSTNDPGFGIWLSEDRYFYTTLAQKLVGFDLHNREWFFTGDVPDRMVMNFTEDDEGRVFLGMYPNAEVIMFDRKDGELTTFGPLAEEEWPQYPSLAADDHGWVYAAIRHHRFNLLGLNPKTGEYLQLIPDETRAEIGRVGGVTIWRSDNGRVYARPNDPEGSQTWFELHNGQASPVDEPKGRQSSFRNNLRRSHFDFPDGSTISSFDIGGRTMEISDDPDQEETRTLRFDYESGGVRIYTLETGPDQRIYGSTGIPLRFFRFDPGTGQMSDWGMGGHGGHINQLVRMGDTLYGAIYSGGDLIAFDPSKPWEDVAVGQAENPATLFSQSAQRDLFGRPFVLLAHSDGKHLLMGGIAYRSLAGGGMLVYNVEEGTHRILTREDLLQDQGVMALAELPGGDILVGTTARASTGGTQVAEAASLYRLSWPDLKRGKVIDPEAGLHLRDLITGPNGRVFGITQNRDLFVYDADKEEIVERVSLGEYGAVTGGQAPRSLKFGPDGSLYVLMSRAIVRIDPETMEHELVASSPVPINAGITIHDHRLYFSSGSELWSFGL